MREIYSLALSNTNEIHTYLDRGSVRGKECINVESEWCDNLYAALQNSLGLMKGILGLPFYIGVYYPVLSESCRCLLMSSALFRASVFRIEQTIACTHRSRTATTLIRTSGAKNDKF